MSDTPLPIRLVQTIGITTSSILAGSVASASFALVPRLLESPTPLLLKQWGNAYNAGKKNAPPFAVLSSACYFYLAYALPSNFPRSKLYGYKDEIVEVGLGNETAHKLVDSWGMLNLGRAALLVVGSLVGTWTALN
jgi:hypothetical protein